MTEGDSVLVRRSRTVIGTKVWVGVKTTPMIRCECGEEVVFWFDKMRQECFSCHRVYEIKKDGTVVFLGIECSDFDCKKPVAEVFKIDSSYYCEECARAHLNSADEWAANASRDLKEARARQRANRKMKPILDKARKTRKKNLEDAERT